MNDNLILFLAIVISGGIGAFLGMLFSKLKNKSEQSTLEERQNQLQITIEDLKQNLSKIENEREEIRREKEFLNTELARKNSEYENLQEQNLKRDKELEVRQEQLRKDFELLANKILEEKSNKFTEQNKENIKNILNPLQEKIQGFEKKVEETQFKSIKMHSALEAQLKGLKDLNQQITKETTNLTKALKGDSQIQGTWGEKVLDRVLEKSGLEKGIAYEKQKSFLKDEGGNDRPDVVIHMPDGKKMIVDSKVSLKYYELLVNTEDENDKTLYTKKHVLSINTHVQQLSEKKYEDIYEMESPNFVLLFIPIESAFALALSEDNTLYNKAFEKNIVIVTPTTLLATLKTIDSLWTNEKQRQNAIEIARQAGALYDKFEGLVSDLTGVGKKIDSAKNDYSSAMNKLVHGRGNLITSVEKLKKMGAKAKKSLPEAIIKRAEEDE